MQFKAIRRFDSIELKYVNKFLKSSIFFCSLLDFDGDERFDFGFPSNFTATASNLVRFSLDVLLTLF